MPRGKTNFENFENSKGPALVVRDFNARVDKQDATALIVVSKEGENIRNDNARQ